MVETSPRSPQSPLTTWQRRTSSCTGSTEIVCFKCSSTLMGRLWRPCPSTTVGRSVIGNRAMDEIKRDPASGILSAKRLLDSSCTEAKEAIDQKCFPCTDKACRVQGNFLVRRFFVLVASCSSHETDSIDVVVRVRHRSRRRGQVNGRCNRILVFCRKRVGCIREAATGESKGI